MGKKSFEVGFEGVQRVSFGEEGEEVTRLPIVYAAPELFVANLQLSR